jgi:hypothetical protein
MQSRKLCKRGAISQGYVLAGKSTRLQSTRCGSVQVEYKESFAEVPGSLREPGCVELFGVVEDSPFLWEIVQTPAGRGQKKVFVGGHNEMERVSAILKLVLVTNRGVRPQLLEGRLEQQGNFAEEVIAAWAHMNPYTSNSA